MLEPTSTSLLPPSSLAQAFEHESVLLRGSPGDALSHIHFECGGRDRDCLPQRLLRLFNPSELAQRGGEPNRAFVKHLRALGYEEGRKLQIDYVQLDTTNTDRSLSMAAELAGRGVDAVRADIDDPTLPLPPSFNLLKRRPTHLRGRSRLITRSPNPNFAEYHYV